MPPEQLKPLPEKTGRVLLDRLRADRGEDAGQATVIINDPQRDTATVRVLRV